MWVTLSFGQIVYTYQYDNYSRITQSSISIRTQDYQYDNLGNRVNYDLTSNCTIMVDNTDDSGLGSLRNAIACASSGDTIQFNSALAGQTINLTTINIELNKNLIFLQPASEIIKIKALTSGSVFIITPGSIVYMENIHLYGGDKILGRAISNSGILTLKNVNIYDSSANAGTGSSIENLGTISIKGNCNIIVE